MGIITLAVLVFRPRGWLPVPLAAATAAGVVLAWALAQNPDMILPALTIDETAAPRSTLRAFLIALPFGTAILIPSLWLLYRTFGREVYAPLEERPPLHADARER